MKYLPFLYVLLLCSCIGWGEEELPVECQVFTGGQHMLRIPVSISPHQIRYELGDTVNIRTFFSDSIYELQTHQRYKISGFPFRPVSTLYRIPRGGWSIESGYELNELYIDSLDYEHYYFYSSLNALGFSANTIYTGSEYRFELNLVLREAGVYILVFTDLYEEYVGSTIDDPLQDEIDAITFEGQCSLLGYYLCSMIDSGDDYLDSFQRELHILDEGLGEGLGHTDESSRDFLEPGRLPVEVNGFFAFEVVE